MGRKLNSQLPTNMYNPAAKAQPINGPTIGTQEYPQSELPFPLIGRMACMILGPISRAGLMA